MRTITVSELTIEVTRKKIKNLHLTIYPPDGRLRVSAPLQVNDEVVRLFVISKLSWIRKQRKKYDQQVRQTPREYVSGESHYWKGSRYLLRAEYGDGKQKVVVKNSNTLVLWSHEGSSVEQRQHIMYEWYRAYLKERVPILIAKWQEIIGVEVKDWGVKRMRTRWGTCNTTVKRIWINLELAKKPDECLEYIVVHEMVHLLERHHNERFKALMDKFMPLWHSHREELNRFPLSHESWEY